jgi:hypothetical protein
LPDWPVPPATWLKNSNLVFGSAGCGRIFDFVIPSNHRMEVRVKINPVPKCLNGRNDSGHKFAPGHDFEIPAQGSESQAAEIPQEPPLILEEHPQPLGDGEDHLAMGHVQKQSLPHPLAHSSRRFE